MTWSIVAREPASGLIGIVAATGERSVGDYVPHIEAGVGAVATQGRPDPSSGTKGLDLLRHGLDAQGAVDALAHLGLGRGLRQIHACDMAGRLGAFTGSALPPFAGHRMFPGDPRGGFSVAGNLLRGPEVLAATAQTFSATDGALAARFLNAMRAGAAAGGDRRGLRSAAMLILDRWGTPVAAAQVDDDPDPLAALARQVFGSPSEPTPGRFDPRRFYDLLPGVAVHTSPPLGGSIGRA